jgi:predicted membrane chloride channel (bestrophin family)
LALFGWVLKSHFRETSANDIVETLLVAPSADASYVLGQRKRPIAILARLRQMMMRMLDSKTISTTEHRLIEDNIRSLDEVITVGERIRASPIPPVYNAHATRLMVVYLFCLPWALLGSNMGATSATVITLVVGFAMLGLDEMSHMFEQPFRFMPLYQIAKVSMLDVADAFCRFPPPLDEREAASVSLAKPAYWSVAGRDPFLPYDGSNFS